MDKLSQLAQQSTESKAMLSSPTNRHTDVAHIGMCPIKMATSTLYICTDHQTNSSEIIQVATHLPSSKAALGCQSIYFQLTSTYPSETGNTNAHILHMHGTMHSAYYMQRAYHSKGLFQDFHTQEYKNKQHIVLQSMTRQHINCAAKPSLMKRVFIN